MRNLIVLAVLVSSVAFAGEDVICTVATATGAASSTASPTTGTCSWATGSPVAMQCTSDTYMSATTPVNGQPVTPATSSSEMVDFTNNKDKICVPIYSGDKHVSLLAATSAGVCKFMFTKRCSMNPGSGK